MKKRRLIFLLCLFLGFTVFAQKRISGTVIDKQNEPLIGVTVMEKGTTNGTITDINGAFSFSVADDNSTIVFSFIGMKSQEVKVGATSTFNIVLESDISDLDEVVVVGYGVQKKKLTTGANVSVAGDNIQKLNTVSALGAMQSQAPGVVITQSSGMPGEGYKVTIRGLGTVGDANPLYVIDGIPGGDINALNPADIETVDVLKDAASAAIYGARAANGVILITTKKGKAGKMTVTYDGYYGVQNPYKIAPLTNAQEYMTLLNEIKYNEGQAPLDFATMMPDIYADVQNGWKGTNWLDEMRNENAPTQNHALNLSGGNDVSTYSMGFSYTGQEGMYGAPVEPNYDRYNVRINSDHILLKKNGMNVIKFGENLTYSYNEKSGIGIGNIYWNDIHNAMVAMPLMPVYNSDGEYYNQADKVASGLSQLSPEASNPIADMVYKRGNNISKNHSLNINGFLEIQPIKGLTWKTTLGYKMNANSYRSYQPKFENLSSTNVSTYDQVNQNMGMGYTWMIDNTLTYVKSFNNHNLSAMVGQSAEKWGMGESVSAMGRNLIFNSGFDYAWLDNAKPATMTDLSVNGKPNDEGSLASFFGRVNYDYKETYMMTLIYRYDGSSNFARGNRWGGFPSVSAGWVMTNEPFMASVKNWMNFMKLRGSWGENGNCNINPFQYLGTIAFDVSNAYSFGNSKTSQSTGAYADKLPNPDVTWETSRQLDLGFDARFLNSRLGVAFDWYKKETLDWLVTPDIPGHFGVNNASVNGGDVKNTGVEVALNWNDRIGELTYGVNFNIAFNKNEVTRIDNSEQIFHGQSNVLSQGTAELFRAQTGYPMGYFWGYKTAGVFQNNAQIADYIANNGSTLQSDPQPGDLIFVDNNHDGVIDTKDKTMIGDPNPNSTIGFSFNLGYKGFDFSVTTAGALGFQIAKSYRSFADTYTQNFTTDIFGRWHGEGTSNKLPRLTSGSNTNWQEISDIYIEDGDYLKIQNVTLGYDFKKLLPKMPVGQFRLYVSAQNLYTITGYSGMDPEVGYGTQYSNGYAYGWAKNIDLGFYPSPRTYLAGVNIKF